MSATINLRGPSVDPTLPIIYAFGSLATLALQTTAGPTSIGGKLSMAIPTNAANDAAAAGAGVAVGGVYRNGSVLQIRVV